MPTGDHAGRKSKRLCMDDHVGGKPLQHSSFAMSADGKNSMLAKRRAQQGDEGDDEDRDEEPMNLIDSPLRPGSRLVCAGRDRRHRVASGACGRSKGGTARIQRTSHQGR